jgi:hypothetical protein
MSSVNDFVQNFTVGSRANLYQVEIEGFEEKLKFVCKAAQIPGKTIGPIEVKYLNNTVKVAGDPVFDDWTITILNDEDFAMRKALDEWQEGIKSNKEAVGDGALTDYFRTATVRQLNRDGSENADSVYKFFNMWPTTVDPMDLAFESADTIVEFGVTFAYSHWEKEA